MGRYKKKQSGGSAHTPKLPPENKEEAVVSIPPLPAPPEEPKAKLATRPHWITILLGVLGLLSPLISAGALYIAILSFRNNQNAVKVSQRAYMSYETSVTNQDEVMKGIAEDKSFFCDFKSR